MIYTEQLEQTDYIQDVILACPFNSSVELQVLAGSVTYRLHSRLIGVESPYAMFVKIGHDNEWQAAKPHMNAGQPVVMRVLNESGFCQILGFRTEIEGLLAGPRKMLSILFPKNIEMAKLRQTSRVKILCACELRWFSQDPLAPPSSTECQLVDLSMTGGRIQIRLDAPLAKGTKIELFFEGEALGIPGIIRNFSRKNPLEVYLGIQFSEPAEPVAQYISRLMLTRMNTLIPHE